MELKKCPFCGGDGKVKSMRFGFETEPRWAVTCGNCAIAIGWEDTEAAAVERWNRRAHEAD